jgi:hypothetical protein
MVCLWGTLVSWTIAGIFTSRIAADRAALSASSTCGIFRFDPNADVDDADRDDLHNYRKEAIAGEYARNCYGNPDITTSMGCGFFFNQSIGYEKITPALSVLVT